MAVALSKPVLADAVFTRSSVKTNIALIVFGAALVGLTAQVNVPLWPVPITGQTLGVMLVGASMGAWRGAASLTTYVVAGLAGVPWFAEFGGGPMYVFKPTFGYLIGFIFTAFVIGYLSERQWDRRPFLSLVAFAIASIIPYIFGLPYLWAVLAAAGKHLTFAQLLGVGFNPFIIGGIIKWVIGAAILPTAWRAVRALDKRTRR